MFHWVCGPSVYVNESCVLVCIDRVVLFRFSSVIVVVDLVVLVVVILIDLVLVNLAQASGSYSAKFEKISYNRILISF